MIDPRPTLVSKSRCRHLERCRPLDRPFSSSERGESEEVVAGVACRQVGRHDRRGLLIEDDQPLRLRDLVG
jgi:hypothetical protein